MPRAGRQGLGGRPAVSARRGAHDNKNQNAFGGHLLQTEFRARGRVPGALLFTLLPCLVLLCLAVASPSLRAAAPAPAAVPIHDLSHLVLREPAGFWVADRDLEITELPLDAFRPLTDDDVNQGITGRTFWLRVRPSNAQGMVPRCAGCCTTRPAISTSSSSYHADAVAPVISRWCSSSWTWTIYKGINDEYGHEAGDQVLVGLAQPMRRTCRPQDVCVRYGGEEFAILLQVPGAHEAMEIAERIRRDFAANPTPYKGQRIRHTLTAGLSRPVTPDAGLSQEAIFLQADDALYRAKRAGRNRSLLAD